MNLFSASASNIKGNRGEPGTDPRRKPAQETGAKPRNRGHETGDRPNAVHFTISGVQSYRRLSGSSPLRGRYCFVRRLTRRGLERPRGLVTRPRAAAATTLDHHWLNCSGGKGAAVGKLAAQQTEVVLEIELVGRVLMR